jgi:hypothetical protein
MPDFMYQARVYLDISWLPRGVDGTLLQQNNANLTGYGPTQGPGTGPAGQTLRIGQAEIVPNAIASPPTVANIVAALTTAAASIGTQITPDVLQQITNWAYGGE